MFSAAAWVRLSSRANTGATPGAPMQDEDRAREERALVERAQRGDRHALRELFARFTGPLYGAVLLPRVGVRAEADELLALTLERAAMRLPDFRYTDAQGIWPWLRRIAMNAIIDRSRRLAAQAGLEERYGAEVATIGPRIEPGAEAELIAEEERRARAKQLELALGGLNERYRRAIELRIFEEKSREECAQLLGVTVSTFDVLLHRAVTSLRKTFGEVM